MRLLAATLLLFALVSSVAAVDFVPAGDINGRGIYKIYNFTNVSANSKICLSGSCISNWSQINSSSSSGNVTVGSNDSYVRLSTNGTHINVSTQVQTFDIRYTLLSVYNAFIATTNAYLTDLSNSNTSTNTRINTINATVGNLQTSNTSVYALVLQLSQNDTNLNTSINAVNTRVNTLNSSFSGNISNLYTNVTALQVYRDAAYINTTDLQNSNLSTNTRVSSVNSTLLGLVLQLSQNDTNLNTSINAVNTRVTTINTTIGGLYTNVTALQSAGGQYGNVTDLQTSNITNYYLTRNNTLQLLLSETTLNSTQDFTNNSINLTNTTQTVPVYDPVKRAYTMENYARGLITPSTQNTSAINFTDLNSWTLMVEFTQNSCAMQNNTGLIGKNFRFGLTLGSTCQLQIGMRNSTYSSDANVQGGNVGAGVRSMGFLRYNHTTKNLSGYINNTLVVSKIVTVTAVNDSTTTSFTAQGIAICDYNAVTAGNNQPFNGTCWQAAAWNKSLSQEDITTTYFSGVTFDGLVAWWPFYNSIERGQYDNITSLQSGVASISTFAQTKAATGSITNATSGSCLVNITSANNSLTGQYTPCGSGGGTMDFFTVTNSSGTSNNVNVTNGSIVRYYSGDGIYINRTTDDFTFNVDGTVLRTNSNINFNQLTNYTTGLINTTVIDVTSNGTAGQCLSLNGTNDKFSWITCGSGGGTVSGGSNESLWLAVWNSTSQIANSSIRLDTAGNTQFRRNLDIRGADGGDRTIAFNGNQCIYWTNASNRVRIGCTSTGTSSEIGGDATYFSNGGDFDLSFYSDSVNRTLDVVNTGSEEAWLYVDDKVGINMTPVQSSAALTVLGKTNLSGEVCINGVCRSSWNPENSVFKAVDEEFLNAGGTQSYGGLAGAAVGTGIAAQATGDAMHPGRVALQHNNASSSAEGYRLLTASVAFLYNGTENASFVMRMPGSYAGRTLILAGFHDAGTATPTTWTDGCTWVINMTHNAGNTARGSCRAAGTETNTSTNYTWVNNTDYVFNQYFNPVNGTTTFTIYNGTGTQLFQANVSANIPRTAGQESGFGIIASLNQSAPAATTLVDIDRVTLSISRVLARY